MLTSDFNLKSLFFKSVVLSLKKRTINCKRLRHAWNADGQTKFGCHWQWSTDGTAYCEYCDGAGPSSLAFILRCRRPQCSLAAPQESRLIVHAGSGGYQRPAPLPSELTCKYIRLIDSFRACPGSTSGWPNNERREERDSRAAGQKLGCQLSFRT